MDSASDNLNYDSYSFTTAWFPCRPNTKYTVSGGNRCRWQEKSDTGVVTFNGQSTTITTSNTAKYLRCYCHNISEITDKTLPNIQIEQGSTATAYEAYIKPEMYIKNNNNIYEKFTTDINMTSSLIVNSTYISDVDMNQCVRNGNVVRVDFRGKVKANIPNDVRFLDFAVYS